MKDITIKGRAIRRERYILLGCFIAAVCVNIYAILKYNRPAIELVTMIGYVLAAAVLIYFLLWIIRLVVLLIAWIVRKIKR